MSVKSFAPLIFSLITSPYVAQGDRDIYLPSKPVITASGEDQLRVISKPEIETKKLNLDENGNLRLEDFNSVMPKLSDLHALIDYSTSLNEIVIHRDYDNSSREHAVRQLQAATNVAKLDFKKQCYSDESLSHAISMLLEPEKKDSLPQELTLNQKVFITRVLYEAKDGKVDDELISALAFLRTKPLTAESQAEISQHS